MSNGQLIPRPFSVTDAKRKREEADRLAEQRDGAALQAVGAVRQGVTDTQASLDLATQQYQDAIDAEAAARQAVEDQLTQTRDELTAAGEERDTRLDAAEAGLTAAKGRLDAAEADILTAQEAADGAMTMAGSKSKVYYSTSTPSGTATGAADLWRQRDAGNNIIGEWRWDTSGTTPAWVQTTISSGAISNLDVGKLTAGSASLVTAVAQKIAAGTASFQTADIKNLFVTDTAAMDTAVAQAIYTRKLAASKIYADEVLIGSGANLFADPYMQDSAGWNNPGLLSTTGGRTTGGSLVIPQGSAQNGSYYGLNANQSNRRPTLVPGGTYRLGGWVKTSTSAPANSLQLYLRYQLPGSATGAAATNVSSQAPLNQAATIAGAWTYITGMVTIPAGTTYTTGVLGAYKEATYTTGTAIWSDLTLQEANSASLQVDGNVTARSLEAVLALVSKIVAGDPNGTRAEMSPSGFRVYAADSTGTVSEVVRMGVAATDDYFAVSKANGQLAATISQDGKIVGDQLIATNALYYKGDELSTIIGRNAGGIEGWGQRVSYSTQNADGSTRMPYLRLNVPVKAGRFYKVSTTPIASEASDATTSAMLYLTYNYSGNAGTFDNTLTQALTSKTSVNSTLQTPLPLVGITAAPSDGYLSVLVAFQASGSGVVGLRGSSSQPVTIFVEDMGPQMYQAGVNLDGTAPPATNVINYYKEYSLTGASSYTGSNAYYAYMENKMFQGESPAGQGNLKSVATYQSMTADLAGATITAMRVYLYFESWYYNAGGTARIGLHGFSAPPATFSQSVADAMVVPGWPKPGGRWVDIPSQYWAGFKSGQYRGISLAAPGGDYQFYGIASESSIISASYTK